MPNKYSKKGLAQLAIRYPFTLNGSLSILNLTYAGLASLLVLSAIPAIVLFAPVSIPILAGIGAILGAGAAVFCFAKGLSSDPSSSNRKAFLLGGGVIGMVIGIVTLAALTTVFPIPIFAIALASIPVIGGGLGTAWLLKKAITHVTGRIASFVSKKFSSPTNDSNWNDFPEDYHDEYGVNEELGKAPKNYPPIISRKVANKPTNQDEQDVNDTNVRFLNAINTFR